MTPVSELSENESVPSTLITEFAIQVGVAVEMSSRPIVLVPAMTTWLRLPSTMTPPNDPLKLRPVAGMLNSTVLSDDLITCTTMFEPFAAST